MMEGKVDKAGVWRFVAILVTILASVWAVSFSAYKDTMNERYTLIQSNSKNTNENTVRLSVVVSELEYLKKGQDIINMKIDNLSKEITKFVKRNDN